MAQTNGSMPLVKMNNYPPGSVVQHRNGYIFVKRKDKRWTPEARLVAELKIAKRSLEPNERVYHMDGNRENNKPDNLSIIRFRTTPYRLLPSSRPLFIPKPVLKEEEILGKVK